MNAATAGLLSIGDELMLGQTVDRNSAWLSGELASIGIECREHRTVPDDAAAIAAALRELAASNALVISTGGLGPTEDDLTREGLAAAGGDRSLVEDAAALAQIEAWFAGRGRPMPASNRRQALRPRDGECLPNAHGTAPGLAGRIGASLAFCLPGPPREMSPMFAASVAPRLVGIAGGRCVRTRAVHAFGLGESLLAERIADLMRRGAEPSVGTTASGGRVSARIRSVGEAEACERAIAAAAAEIRRRWSPYAYGEESETLADAVGGQLAAAGATVAVAESCTAGLLSATLVESAGASRYHLGGWIVYSNELKHRQLGVPREMLERHGAVSAEVAATLARQAAIAADATYALSVTGIAGPGGAVEGKPVGTVFVGLSDRSGGSPLEQVRRILVPGDRQTVRERSVGTALMMLRLRLLGQDDAPLLWEQR